MDERIGSSFQITYHSNKDSAGLQPSRICFQDIRLDLIAFIFSLESIPIFTSPLKKVVPYMRFLCFLLFFCTIICYSQTSPPSYTAAIETYLELQKVGARSRLDTLYKVFENISERKDITTREVLGTLIYRARIRTNQNKFTKAAELLEEAKSLRATMERVDASFDHTIAYYDLFLTQKLSKKSDGRSIHTFFEAYQGRPDNDSYVEALMYEFMGRFYQDQGDYEASVLMLKEAIDRFKVLESDDALSVSYTVLGATYAYLEDFKQEAAYYDAALRKGATLEEPNYDVLASTAYNLSLLHGDRLGNVTKGIEYAHAALTYDLAGGGEENVYLASDFSLLADNYSRASNYTQAMLYADKAISHARLYAKKSPNVLGVGLRTRSQILSKMGRHQEAITVGKESLAIVKEVVGENHRWTCSQLLNLAGVYLAEGSLAEAEIYYLKTEKVAKAIQRDLFLVEVYQNLAKIYTLDGNWKNAHEVLDRLNQVLNDKFKDADYFHKMLSMSYVKLFEAEGESEKAIDHLSALSKKMNNLYRYPDIRIDIKAYEALLAVGDDTNAYHSFISAVVQARNLYPNRFNKIVYANTIKEQISKVLAKAYEQYIKTNDPNLLQILGTLMELNKNSVLLEGVQNDKLKEVSGVPKTVLSFENTLLDSLQVAERQLYLSTQSSSKDISQLKALRDKQLLFERSFDSLQLEITSNYPRLSRLKQLSAQTDYTEVQKNLLNENELILEYFVDSQHWYRMAISKNHIEIVSDTTFATIDSLTTELLTAISSQRNSLEQATRLGDLLLPQIPSGTEHIILVTDGILSLLPFEVLIQEDKSMVESYAMSYTGSLQLLAEQKAVKNSGKSWVGFAPSYKDAPLPNNQLEVVQIKKIIGGDSFVGDEATKLNFIMKGSSYDVLHLAAHTEIDQNNPYFNKMLFSDFEEDGALTASEIYGLNLSANLVVLSSCNTGFGRLEKGEGVMSMSRAFTYAGVGSTLMSLWKVPDKETTKITSYFYENLSVGLAKDVALQKAKKKYLETTKDAALKHPFYWAGFVLSGNTSAITISENSPYVWLLWGATGIILLLLIKKKWAISKK